MKSRVAPERHSQASPLLKAVRTTVRRAAKHTHSAWHALNLSSQFLIASIAATLVAMLIVGNWISHRIENSVAQNAAFETALYVESFIGERIQTLATETRFRQEMQSELETLVLRTPFGRRITTFKVWLKGGRVIYASNRDEVGKTYPPTGSLRQAWQGTVSFEVDQLSQNENKAERQLNIPLLEIYVPVRARFGGDIIAVVELYEDAKFLVDDIRQAKIETWTLLAIIGLGVVAALWGMASRASRTIEGQRAALNRRITDLSSLLEQNQSLRLRVENASRRVTALNERYLRRVGADLHDGPAQLITLALLRLDASQQQIQAADGSSNDYTQIRGPLHDALREIRNVSIGLTIPELENMSLTQTLREAVRAHEHRTGARITIDISTLPATIPRDIQLAAYRFVQEGLNNAHKHATGASVTLSAGSLSEDWFRLQLQDDGPGFEMTETFNTDRIGLSGLQERIDCIGGTFEVCAAPGQGTRLLAKLPTHLIEEANAI